MPAIHEVQDTVSETTPAGKLLVDQHPYITALYQMFSNKYNIWLGTITLLVVLLWGIVFYMLCPCFKTIRRWIMSHADDINERLEVKIRKREEKRQRLNRNKPEDEYVLLDHPNPLPRSYRM